MSAGAETAASTTSFRVRWKDPITGSRLVETLYTREDALDFQAHLRLATRRGVLSELDLGRELVDFAAERWTRFATYELAKTTRTTYASMWNTHLLPRVGHLELRQITPGVVDQLKSDLQEDGVGAATIRKTLSVLQAMLRQAVAWDRLRLNPVKQITKPQRLSVGAGGFELEDLPLLHGCLHLSGVRVVDRLVAEPAHTAGTIRRCPSAKP